MKTRLDETNHMRKLMGLPLINEGYSGDDKPHWKRLVTKYGDEHCSWWENRRIRHDDIVDNIKRQPKIFIKKLEDAQKSNDKNNPYWGSPFSKIELSKNSIDQFIADLENYIIGHCVSGRDGVGRKIVLRSLNELEGGLLDLMKKLKPSGTDIVANFDKEKVTDDLANKTTIKDGVVHVPFSVDDFPKEDWDLYFEDFDVSNNKFGFTDYVVKEYGAGKVDTQEIWKEYQEAILHRLMDEG